MTRVSGRSAARANVENRACPVLHDVTPKDLRRQNGTSEVQVDHFAQCVERNIEEILGRHSVGGGAYATRTVDQMIDVSKVVERFLPGAFQTFTVGHIAFKCQCFATTARSRRQPFLPLPACD